MLFVADEITVLCLQDYGLVLGQLNLWVTPQSRYTISRIYSICLKEKEELY